MAIFPGQGLSVVQLESLLKDLGDYVDPQIRQTMMEELFRRKAVENELAKPAPRYNQQAGMISSAVSATYDPFSDKGGAMQARAFDQFANEYLEGMAAVKEVLEFLKAQNSMDLFQGNAKAKRVYESIIAAGTDEVLYNNRRWANK